MGEQRRTLAEILAARRIKMRVLGILLIISLGCLSALDVESGRFEDGHLGVNEITKVPKTEVAEMVLPQPSLEVEASVLSVRQSHLVEKNIKRIKARKNWQAKRKAWLKAWHVHNANSAKKRAARKIAREKNKKSRAKERIKKKHLWALMKKEGPAKKIKAKEKNGKKRKGKLLAKQKKANEKKAKKKKVKEKKDKVTAKKVAKEKAKKEKRKKEKLGKRKKKRAKELKAKRKKALEKKAKLAKEKRIKKRKLRRLKAKELKDKIRAKEQHTKV